MIFKNVVLEGIEAYLSDEIFTSDQIESQLDEVYTKLNLPQGRLELMTGITERRVWPSKTRPSDIASMAAQKLIKKLTEEESICDQNDFDQLIHASVCRDFLEPSTASVIHKNLNLKQEVIIFDLSNACLGVVSAMTMVSQLIESGAIKRALIVSGENATPLIEETIKQLIQKVNRDEINRKSIKKYLANLTIGSAAMAISLCHKSLSPKNKPLIQSSYTLTDSSANHLCQGDGDTSALMMETDSEALMQAGVKLAKKSWSQYQAMMLENNLTTTPDWVITHQVGVAHDKLTRETLNIGDIKTHKTYPKMGNTGSAALPLTLWDLLSQKKVSPREHIALLGIGSGLTSTIMGLQC